MSIFVWEALSWAHHAMNPLAPLDCFFFSLDDDNDRHILLGYQCGGKELSQWWAREWDWISWKERIVLIISLMMRKNYEASIFAFIRAWRMASSRERDKSEEQKKGEGEEGCGNFSIFKASSFRLARGIMMMSMKRGEKKKIIRNINMSFYFIQFFSWDFLSAATLLWWEWYVCKNPSAETWMSLIVVISYHELIIFLDKLANGAAKEELFSQVKQIMSVVKWRENFLFMFTLKEFVQTQKEQVWREKKWAWKISLSPRQTSQPANVKSCEVKHNGREK